MPSNTKQLIMVGALVVGLLTASGLAVHFKNRAAHYQQQFAAALVGMDEVPVFAATGRTSSVGASIERYASQPVDLQNDIELVERIRELEEALERRDLIISDMRRRNVLLAVSEAGEETPREQRDWLAELRESDPERYEEVMQRREEARQRVQDVFARQAAHFLYRDQAYMSEAERVEYNHMLSLLSEAWQLSGQLQGDDLSPEQRRELRRELMSNMRTLRPMLETERDREFYEMGLQLGYDEYGAADFVNYINEMLEITSFSGMWGGGGMGNRGGGPGR